MNSSKWKAITAVLLAATVTLGCRGAKSDAPGAGQNSHMRSLVTVFNFASAKLGHRPASEAELKAFINANGQPMIESLKISSADDLFISERDGQPFVVLYGSAPKGEARDVVAYEQSGQSGKRLVGYSLGAIGEVDEAQFATIAPAADQAPKAPGK